MIVLEHNIYEKIEENLKNNEIIILADLDILSFIEQKLYMQDNNDKFTLFSGDLGGTGKIVTIATAYKTQELREFLGVDDDNKWEHLLCICQGNIGDFSIGIDAVYEILSLGITKSIRMMLISISSALAEYDHLFNKEVPFKWGHLLSTYVFSEEYQECWFNKKKKTARKRTHIPKGLRHEVFKRDNYTCVECGATKEDGAKLHIDHIIPVSKGGTDELSNLQTLCDKCNLNKSNLIQ